MEFYNYTGMRNQTAERSAQVVEKFRKQYASNIEMYNYTKAGKQKMIEELIAGMEKELASLKNGFMANAKEGVYTNKQKLIDSRATAAKTGTDKTNELLAFFKQVALYDAKIALYGADMQLLQQLSEDENISDDLFQIVQAKMVGVADDDMKANLRAMKKKDLKMEKVDGDIADFRTLESQINSPILPVSLADKDSYELITGENRSDYFFQQD